MSQMDGLTDVEALIKRAINWGHTAIGITDHGVVHTFPKILSKAGDKIKPLYGVEGYYINDVDSRPAVFGEISALPGELVVFDIETTGLHAFTDAITEIAAVTMRGGEVISEFHTYTNPGKPIPPNITELTGITDETVRGAPDNLTAVKAFLDYAADRPMAAHNAGFDLGFIFEVCHRSGIAWNPVCFDTVTLARAFFPDLFNHKLPTVAQALTLPKFDHHHALADATVTGHIAARFLAALREENVTSSFEINVFCRKRYEHKIHERARHIIIYAKTQAGIRNLYKLVTKSHLDNFKRNPIIYKSDILQLRDGLLIGAACEAGEIFNAVERGSRFEQQRLARFYDYLEIQPVANNMFMLKGTKPRAHGGEEALRDFNRRVVALGRETGKPVCATCDAHFLDPEDEIYRRVLMASRGFDNALDPLPLYFRTTEEMLGEFSYLGEETAYEVVVTNTNLIADMIDAVRPIPPAKTLYAPKIKGSADDLKSMVYNKLRENYGGGAPDFVLQRVETELSDILGRGYDVIYMSAQRVVADSLAHGYLVGSRGSVGSSLVAYLAGITEVNSLPAHYLCPNCRRSDFNAGAGYGCGADMPDAACPDCGAPYKKDGFDIPFETFLGFGGDKVPDIDLNFSGEYQASAHKYTTELFGPKNVYRAGTIGTLKDKNAYGFVKKYLELIGQTVSRAEENRLIQGLVGIKSTTGQHPGGLVIVPQGMDIVDFCPAQHPADDAESDITTLHFEYHDLEDNLLKLDELGHDDPTMIKMLEDLTETDGERIDARQIPLDDPETMRIFRTATAIGLTDDDPVIGKTGSIGIPEFGTGFTRGMLNDTLPETFDTLVRLSGFSHGTDVWNGNAKDLIASKTADISETIGCRDDIMLFLISKGMAEKRAFKIMENVRKGRALPDGAEDEMRSLGVPDWYIGSCKKIKYLFPKAHAVAYVMMAFRIAWFKVHRPLAFYSAYFYRRSQKDAFDASIMTRGDELVLRTLRELNSLPDKEKKGKSEKLLTTLEACHEFYARGFTFENVDLYRSDPVAFELVGANALRPPLISVAGLGEIAARDIAANRLGREFVSIEEFTQSCAKVTSAHIDQLKRLGSLSDMPDTSQITMF
jgi:DNA polymerase-3 subunit alpha (Gram-positive type)